MVDVTDGLETVPLGITPLFNPSRSTSASAGLTGRSRTMLQSTQSGNLMVSLGRLLASKIALADC